MFGIGRDPDLPQVTLWRDFEEPLRLPTVQPGDLRVLYPSWFTLRPGELSFVVSHPSPPVPATDSELNDGDNERSTSGEEHGFEVVHVNSGPERACFETDLLIRPETHRITWLHVFSFLPKFHPVVKILLAHGADPNAVASAICMRWDLTPLHFAATPETARLLLEYKAKVDVEDSYGCTPLLRATLNGRHSVVEVLLAHGANPNVTDKDGRSPLFVASEEGHLSVVDVLLAYGANPNVTDEDGRSPLFVASEEGHHSVVEVLLAHGANPNVTDKDGRSPLFVAAMKGHHSVVDA
ncbi:unnamed protein product, partial [Cyprideis torosa]